MTACTRTVTPADPLEDIIKQLPDGAVLCLSDGVYGRLWIERSLTVRGLGNEVVLEGNGNSTISVVRKDIDFTLEHVVLRRGFGGAMGSGGNLHVDQAGRIVLRDVVLEDGESDHNGGGAINSDSKELLLERCVLRGNFGVRGSAIQLQPGSKFFMRDSVVVGNSASRRGGGEAPAIFLDGGSDVTIERSTIVNAGPAIRLKGSRESTTVSIIDSIVGDPPLEGPPSRDTATRVVVRNCALSRAVPSTQDGGGNVVGKIELDAEHRPVAGSIAVGKGPRR
jgi:hypothetical protein